MTQVILIPEEDNSAVPMAYTEKDGVKGVMAKDSNRQKLRETVKVSVLKTFKSLGKSFEVADASFIVDGLVMEILRKFPNIRLEEIGLALHKLSVGEVIPADKIYSLSLIQFVQAIRMHMGSHERIEALKQNNSGVLLLSETTAPSEQEQEARRIETCLTAWQTYLKTDNYNDYGNFVFNALCKLSVIDENTFTDAEKGAILKNAIVRLKNRFSRRARNDDERFENKRKLAEIKADPYHYLIDLEGYHVALSMFFKRCKENNIDLKSKIKPELCRT